MRKTYIKPIIEAETIEVQNLMDQSPQIKVEDPFEEKPQIPTKPEPTDDPNIFGAKGGSTWSDDAEW